MHTANFYAGGRPLKLFIANSTWPMHKELKNLHHRRRSRTNNDFGIFSISLHQCAYISPLLKNNSADWIVFMSKTEFHNWLDIISFSIWFRDEIFLLGNYIVSWLKFFPFFQRRLATNIESKPYPFSWIFRSWRICFPFGSPFRFSCCMIENTH